MYVYQGINELEYSIVQITNLGVYLIKIKVMRIKKIEYGTLFLVLLENKTIFIFFSAFVISHLIDITLIVNDSQVVSSWHSFIPEVVLLFLGVRKLFLRCTGIIFSQKLTKS